MKSLLFSLIAAAGLALPYKSHAQAEEQVDEYPTLSLAPPPAPADTYSITWPTTAGRHYYLEVSTSLESNAWTYGPVAVTGTGANLVQPITVSTTPTGRCFVRIQWFTDANRAPSADYDGDGLSNANEVTLHGTLPFNADSDGDGLDDGPEITGGTDPLVIDMPEITLQHRWRQGNAWRDGGYNKRIGSNSAPANSSTVTFSAPIFNAASETLAAMGQFQGLSLVPWGTTASAAALTAHVHACLAPPDYTAPGGTDIAEGLSTADCRELEYRLVSSRAVAFPITRTFLQTKRMRLGTGAWTYETITNPVVDLTIPARVTVSPASYRPMPEWTPGLPSDSTTFRREIIVQTPSIEPDADMAGVVGDVIKSALPNSTIRHFVSPKKFTVNPDPDLPQDYVILKAVNVTAEQITPNQPSQTLVWDGGEEVPGEPLKRRVRRDTPAPRVVKIRAIQGGKVAAQMYVWIVRAVITPTQGTVQWGEEVPGTWRYNFVQPPINGWRFKFRIEPATIITDKEVPDLCGSNTKPPPGAAKPYAGDPQKNADHAALKWDVSRQMKKFIRNPGMIPKADLKTPPFTGTYFDNQPQGEDTPVNFPADSAEGNDDPLLAGVGDEDADPYYRKAGNGLDHAAGELSSFDAPSYMVMDAWGGGAHDRIFTHETNYREFARLELWDGQRTTGRFWFRISEFHLWHHALKAKFDGPTAKWQNNGSASNIGALAP